MAEENDDNSATPPLETAVQARLRETVRQVLASLTPREQQVLGERFGMGIDSDDTLEELGRQFSVTRERIRQIEAKARRKLERCKGLRRRHEIRPFEPGDLPRVAGWLRQPHVARWWSEWQEEVEWLLRHLIEHTFDAFILELGGRPVGYLQVYDASPGADDEIPGQPPGSRGLDLLIGEPELLGQGHGPAFVDRICTRLFGDPAVSRLIVDPHPENHRSIRAFDKAGFGREREALLPWGPAVLMVRSRDRHKK